MSFRDAALVTHRNCSDGSVCAVLFLAAGGLKTNIYYTTPNQDVDDTVRDLYFNWEGPIFIVDVSVSVKLAELLESRNNIYLLDHHKSAMPLTKFRFCNIEENNNRCGSKMFYDWIQDNTNVNIIEYEDLVTFIDDHDRWILSFLDSKEIAILHDLIGQKLFVDRFYKSADCELSANERYMIDIHNTKEASIIDDCKRNLIVKNLLVDGKNYNVGIIYSSHPFLNSVSHSILEDLTLNVDVVMSISSRSISLRSKNDGLDVSKLCKINGGGGHKNAAGCSIASILSKSLDEIVFENLKTNSR